MPFTKYFLPFSKRIKFWTALKWWLYANIRPWDSKRRLKYCSECGWPVVYLDDLYDVDYTYSPDVIAMCSLCGTEFIKFIADWSDKIRAVMPKKETS